MATPVFGHVITTGDGSDDMFIRADAPPSTEQQSGCDTGVIVGMAVVLGIAVFVLVFMMWGADAGGSDSGSDALQKGMKDDLDAIKKDLDKMVGGGSKAAAILAGDEEEDEAEERMERELEEEMWKHGIKNTIDAANYARDRAPGLNLGVPARKTFTMDEMAVRGEAPVQRRAPKAPAPIRGGY